MQQHFCRTNNVVGGAEELDGTLCLRVATSPNMDVVVEELHNVLESACRRSFRILRTTKKALQHKSVPCWTEGLNNSEEKGKCTATEVSTDER
jgi:hypothetical protein